MAQRSLTDIMDIIARQRAGAEAAGAPEPAEEEMTEEERRSFRRAKQGSTQIDDSGYLRSHRYGGGGGADELRDRYERQNAGETGLPRITRPADTELRRFAQQDLRPPVRKRRGAPNVYRSGEEPLPSGVRAPRGKSGGKGWDRIAQQTKSELDALHGEIEGRGNGYQRQRVEGIMNDDRAYGTDVEIPTDPSEISEELLAVAAEPSFGSDGSMQMTRALVDALMQDATENDDMDAVDDFLTALRDSNLPGDVIDHIEGEFSAWSDRSDPSTSKDIDEFPLDIAGQIREPGTQYGSDRTFPRIAKPRR